jgi:6,7-dimethyl-8-ribityllumazine synthase
MTKKGIVPKKMDGAGLCVGVVVSRWNEDITGVLLSRATEALSDCGVRAEDVCVFHTPGSFELPYAAKRMIQEKEVDAVITLGCLIKGETAHFDYICSAVAKGIMDVGLTTSVPIIFGVLTCFSLDQAVQRARPDGSDHGYEWGLSAVEMALLS